MAAVPEMIETSGIQGSRERAKGAHATVVLGEIIFRGSPDSHRRLSAMAEKAWGAKAWCSEAEKIKMFAGVTKTKRGAE